MDARAKASRPYIGGTLFDFGNKPSEHEELRRAIVELYKACLLDIGLNSVTSDLNRDYFDIAYPREG